MLTTIGQGVVLNALLAAGYTASSHDFDIARLFLRHGEDVIRVELTVEVDFGNRRELKYNDERTVFDRLRLMNDLHARGLLPPLEALTETLKGAGCKFVGSPDAWVNTLCFERIDSVQLGTPHGGPAASHFQKLTTKLKIRVTY